MIDKKASYNGQNCTILQLFQYFYETFAIIELEKATENKYILKVHIKDLRPYILLEPGETKCIKN